MMKTSQKQNLVFKTILENPDCVQKTSEEYHELIPDGVGR